MNGEIPLDEVVTFDEVTSSANGAAVDADATPTYSVFEEVTDTPILSAQSFTKRTSLTGNYRGQFTVSAANGFEVGKWYNVISSATVASVAGKKKSMTFRVIPAEVQVGYAKVDLQYVNGAVLPGGVPDVNVSGFTAGALNAAALNIDTGLKPIYTFNVVSLPTALSVTAPLGAHTTPQYYRWMRYKGIASDGANQEGFIVDYTGSTTRQFTFDRAPVVPFVVGSTISIFSASPVDVAAWKNGVVPATSIAGAPKTDAAYNAGVAITATGGRQEVNVTRWVGDVPAGLLGTGLLSVDVDSFDTDPLGLAKIARSTKCIVSGTVGTGSTTTSVVSLAMSPAPSVANQFGMATIVFASDTTTSQLRCQRARFSSMTAGGVFTLIDTLTTSPVSGDIFVVV